jgi:hypothetical protein
VNTSNNPCYKHKNSFIEVKVEGWFHHGPWISAAAAYFCTW